MAAPMALSRKVVLAAGGTGGHMFPAEALARELLARGTAVALVTDARGRGFNADDLAAVETFRIAAGAMAGAGLVKQLRSTLSLGLGYLQARGHLKRSGAEVAVGFGGYPSVPTVMAAAHRGLRVVLHEQNAVLGRANRLLAGRATVIATCFEKVEGVAPGDRAKLRLTGNPVRQAIAAVGEHPYPTPGADSPLTLLVFGGSQGARVFNEIVPAAVARLPEALRQRLKVHQQVPGDAVPEVAAAYDACGVRHALAPFFSDMPQRLAAAQLVISRAGASTVAELAAAGRPAVMVPFPSATDDHQTSNAQALVEVGGGWLMPQAGLDAASLAERLASLLNNPPALVRAAGCARAAAHLEAARDLADLVCGITNGGGRALRGSGDSRKEAAA